MVEKKHFTCFQNIQSIKLNTFLLNICPKKKSHLQSIQRLAVQFMWGLRNRRSSKPTLQHVI